MTNENTNFENLAQFSPNNGENYRTIPHNEEVEQALLGALLVNNKALEKVLEFLKPQHFYNSVHERIYAAIVKFVERGQDASPATLKSYFEKDEALSHVGGGQYLADLAANVVSVLNIADYGRTIYELHIRRALIALGEEVVNDAYEYDLDKDASVQIEDTEKKLFDLATAGDYKGGFIPFSDSLTKAIKLAEVAFQSDGEVTGVTSGLIDLDKKIGGFQKSDLIILAGRPSMGKSTLAIAMGANAARAHLETKGEEGAVCAFFSLEMSSDQIASKMLSERSNVPSDNIRRGEVKDTDFHKFIDASHEMAQMPFFIDDTAALTMSAIRTRSRRLKRQHNLGMIIIDYLQLIDGGTRGGASNRVQEVSEITRGLKALAKELDVPVIALSQLSRQVENRDNKRPQLSDLRESGSIEQDADIVMFVYRDEYYLEREEPGRKPEESEEKFNQRYADWQTRMEENHNVAECILAKQRHGPIGTVRLMFEGAYSRFSNLETHRQHDDYE